MKKTMFVMGLILSLSAQADQMYSLGLNFQAPTVNGKANATNPVVGEIVFDTSDNTFYGNTDGTGSGWTAFGAPGYQILTTTSAQKTPAGSGYFHALTSNSITLTAGKWRIWCTGNFDNNGSTPAYAAQGVNFYAANGADNGTAPAGLSTTSGLTVLSAREDGIMAVYSSSAASSNVINSAPTVVQCTSSCAVYCVPYSGQTTSSNARIKVYFTGEKIQ